MPRSSGVAVNAFGFARATRDVDVITSIPLAEVRGRLKKRGIESRLHKGDPLEGDFSCLKGVVDVANNRSRRPLGVPFDVLPQLVSIGMEDLDRLGQGPL